MLQTMGTNRITVSRYLSPPPRNFDDDQPLQAGLDDFESAQHRRWSEVREQLPLAFEQLDQSMQATP